MYTGLTAWRFTELVNLMSNKNLNKINIKPLAVKLIAVTFDF